MTMLYLLKMSVAKPLKSSLNWSRNTGLISVRVRTLFAFTASFVVVVVVDFVVVVDDVVGKGVVAVMELNCSVTTFLGAGG